MKLIIVGATGFVGTEILRQSLLRKDITSVVAVTRRALSNPASTNANADLMKLKNVVVKDYDQYTDDAKSAFKGADGCIWTIAITPLKSKAYTWDEVIRVCQTSTIVGMQAMHDSGVATPFRFIYMSGAGAERDQSKTPARMPEVCLMRGETESKVLAFAAQHGMETAVVRPGFIVDGLARRALAGVMAMAISLPSISLQRCVAAMLEQVVGGIGKDPVMNDEMVEIGKKVEAEGRMV